MTYFLRTAGNPLGVAGAVANRAPGPRADPVAALSTQTAQIEREMVPETLFARLCTAFAMLSLAIACVGLYGTTLNIPWRGARAKSESAWHWGRSAQQ